MRETLIALGLAWAVMTLVGCGVAKSRVLLGDQTGTQYIERHGLMQNLTTGDVSRRVSPNFVQNLRSGRLEFTYGNFIEERAQGSRSSPARLSR